MGAGIKIWVYDAANDVWRELVVNALGQLVIVAA